MSLISGFLSLLLLSHTIFNYELEKYANNGYCSSKIDYHNHITVLNDYLFENISNKLNLNKVWFLYSHIPPKKYYGFIGSRNIAEDIASSLWVYKYGFQILREKPFNSYLRNNNVWVIYSTVPHTVVLKNHPTIDTLIVTGGVAYMEIRKKDGKILKIGYDV